MRCPFCGELDTKVIDSRLSLDGYSIKRRRSCPSCNSRYNTQETTDLSYPRVIKNDKSRQKKTAKIPSSLARMFVNPFTESSVEEMNSRGIGALTVQPLEEQTLEGRGYWYDGYWNVVFIRNLEATSKWDIDFSVKNQVVLAFALWDGNKKDMSANKMVSFWQTMNFR